VPESLPPNPSELRLDFPVLGDWDGDIGNLTSIGVVRPVTT
jgi:hypothetical protein